MKMFTHNRDAEISLGPRFAWKCRPSLWSLKKSLSDRIDVYKWVLQSAVTYISLTFANFVWNPCCCSFLILSPCTRAEDDDVHCVSAVVSHHTPLRGSPHIVIWENERNGVHGLLAPVFLFFWRIFPRSWTSMTFLWLWSHIHLTDLSQGD